jgi:phage terminase small subunit
MYRSFNHMDVKTTVTLSAPEEAFVLALARGLKPTRAATAAGYAVASARNLLRKPHIDAAVRTIAANLVQTVQRMDAGAGAA